jgi:DNA (cytosine-5)-methyltransferase 1
MASGHAKNGTQEAMNGMYVAGSWDGSQTSPTLTANNAGGNQRMPDMDNFNAVVQTLDMFRCCATDDISMTLQARNYKDPQCIGTQSIVRRLTPLECERLQGFPDAWTDIGDWTDEKGKKHKGDSDSPRYKALGNSIALPFWAWLARRICSQYERPMTMASLFDGIGGFPLVFSRVGCCPVWASEIEEFPMAVTKRRFPE